MILDSKDHPEWEVPQKDVQKSGKYRKTGVCFVRHEKLWHFFFCKKVRHVSCLGEAAQAFESLF